MEKYTWMSFEQQKRNKQCIDVGMCAWSFE